MEQAADVGEGAVEGCRDVYYIRIPMARARACRNSRPMRCTQGQARCEVSGKWHSCLTRQPRTRALSKHSWVMLVCKRMSVRSSRHPRITAPPSVLTLVHHSTLNTESCATSVQEVAPLCGRIGVIRRGRGDSPGRDAVRQMR